MSLLSLASHLLIQLRNFFLFFLVRLLAQIIVDSMHERKVEMARRVGGFIGLPGGYGTFEEVRK